MGSSGPFTTLLGPTALMLSQASQSGSIKTRIVPQELLTGKPRLLMRRRFRTRLARRRTKRALISFSSSFHKLTSPPTMPSNVLEMSSMVRASRVLSRAMLTFAGISTVCVVDDSRKFGTPSDRGKDLQYFANVALKFNLKLGGQNQVLDGAKLGIIDEGKTMVVGLGKSLGQCQSNAVQTHVLVLKLIMVLFRCHSSLSWLVRDRAQCRRSESNLHYPYCLYTNTHRYRCQHRQVFVTVPCRALGPDWPSRDD